jgi:hypothetical protein
MHNIYGDHAYACIRCIRIRMRRLNVASCVLHRLDRSTRIGMTHRPPHVSSATPMSFDASAYPPDTDDRYAASILHMYHTPAANAGSVPPLTVAAASVIPSGVNHVDSTPVYARSLEQRVVTMEFVQVRMLNELRELTTRVCASRARSTSRVSADEYDEVQRLMRENAQLQLELSVAQARFGTTSPVTLTPLSTSASGSHKRRRTRVRVIASTPPEPSSHDPHAATLSTLATDDAAAALPSAPPLPDYTTMRLTKEQVYKIKRGGTGWARGEYARHMTKEQREQRRAALVERVRRMEEEGEEGD